MLKKVWNDCEKCKGFEECYKSSFGSDLILASIPEYFNCIRKRDLCVYNDKKLFEDRES